MLSTRLQAVLDMAPKARVFYDIGANHGLLGIEMLRTGKADKAWLCDCSAKALSKAQENVEKYRIGDKAQLHVGDGFNGLSVQEGDCAALCGMGARLMLKILPKEPLACTLLLQPNIEPQLIRKSIARRGLVIEDECLAFDGGRHYVGMRLKKGQAKPLSVLEEYMGPCLMRARADALNSYMLWRLRVLERATGLGSADKKVFEELAIVEEGLKWLSQQ